MKAEKIMTIIKQIAFALAVTFFVMMTSAQAQTPSIAVTTESHQAQFAAQGEVQEMRVEVFAPSGERVFDSGTVTGTTVEWNMQTKKGERVSDGVYLATLTITDAAGKINKRSEQITISREPQTDTLSPAAPSATPTTITGTGTGSALSGYIARFTGESTIGDSVIRQNISKTIGINTNSSSARLHIYGEQPLATSYADGAIATSLLQTSGGKGGDTTAAGKTGGKGASISLLAGTGGNAVSGAVNGNGGSITLQPGSAGTGGTGGATGNVLIAPTVGNVGIGTNSPTAKLEVKGTLGAILKAVNSGSGDGVVGLSESNLGMGVYGDNSSSGFGVVGTSNSGDGVYGRSISGTGVHGESDGGGYAGFFSGKARITGSLEIGGNASIPTANLSFGSTARQMLNLWKTEYALGVQTSTLYSRTAGGFAWFRGGTHNNAQNNPGGGTLLMKLDSAGNLTAKSFTPTSDRAAKTNFALVNPQRVLARLAEIPIQSWNFKDEPESVRHIGPTAQDFRSAFNLGADDKHISTIDADGVALAAIQGLYQLVQEKETKIEQQNAEIKQQSQQIAELQARMSQLERTTRKKRAARR